MRDFSPEKLEQLQAYLNSDISDLQKSINDIQLFDYDGIYGTDLIYSIQTYAGEFEERNYDAAIKVRLAFENVWDAEYRGSAVLNEVKGQLKEYNRYVQGLSEVMRSGRCSSPVSTRLYVGGLNRKVLEAELSSLEGVKKGFLSGLQDIMMIGSEIEISEISFYINEFRSMYAEGLISETDYLYITLSIQAYQHAPAEVQNIIKSQLLLKCEEIKVGLALKEYIQQSNKEYTYDFIKMYNEGYFSQEDYEYFKFCINTCENVAENERKEILEQLVNKYAELECIYILKLNFEELNITDIEEQQKICNVVGTMNPTMLQKISDFQNMSEEQIKEHVSNLIDYYNNKIHLYITPEDVKTLSFCDEDGKYYDLDETQEQVFLSFWYTLIEMDLTYEQIVGVLANIYEESQFSCTNAQDSRGYKGKYNEDYFFNVDDKIGYGLLQWTVSDRKTGLLNLAIEQGGSVSDLNIQLAYFKEEMSDSYQSAWLALLEKETIRDATFHFMDEIESPQVNNIEDRMLYANSIAEWYEREVLKEE